MPNTPFTFSNNVSLRGRGSKWRVLQLAQEMINVIPATQIRAPACWPCERVGEGKSPVDYFSHTCRHNARSIGSRSVLHKKAPDVGLIGEGIRGFRPVNSKLVLGCCN